MKTLLALFQPIQYNMKFTAISLGIILSFILVSCSNPADSTVDAEISEVAEPATSLSGQTYVFSENSTIAFIGSKVTGSREGGFKKFTGSFDIKDGEPESGEFTIDMNSTWSDADKLTKHLKNSDFFDVENYPETKFVATAFSKKSDGKYDLSGNFTLRGVTKNITFPTTVKQTGDSVTIAAEFDINRQDFGISYAGKVDDLIRDEVVIKLNLISQAQ
jgi:polyisoprenoid-binding protein YceI